MPRVPIPEGPQQAGTPAGPARIADAGVDPGALAAEGRAERQMYDQLTEIFGRTERRVIKYLQDTGTNDAVSKFEMEWERKQQIFKDLRREDAIDSTDKLRAQYATDVEAASKHWMPSASQRIRRVLESRMGDYTRAQAVHEETERHAWSDDVKSRQLEVERRKITGDPLSDPQVINDALARGQQIVWSWAERENSDDTNAAAEVEEWQSASLEEMLGVVAQVNPGAAKAMYEGTDISYLVQQRGPFERTTDGELVRDEDGEVASAPRTGSLVPVKDLLVSEGARERVLTKFKPLMAEAQRQYDWDLIQRSEGDRKKQRELINESIPLERRDSVMRAHEDYWRAFDADTHREKALKSEASAQIYEAIIEQVYGRNATKAPSWALDQVNAIIPLEDRDAYRVLLSQRVALSKDPAFQIEKTEQDKALREYNSLSTEEMARTSPTAAGLTGENQRIGEKLYRAAKGAYEPDIESLRRALDDVVYSTSRYKNKDKEWRKALESATYQRAAVEGRLDGVPITDEKELRRIVRGAVRDANRSLFNIITGRSGDPFFVETAAEDFEVPAEIQDRIRARFEREIKHGRPAPRGITPMDVRDAYVDMIYGRTPPGFGDDFEDLISAP